MVASKLVRIVALFALAACATTIPQNEGGRPVSSWQADHVPLKREDAISRAKHVSQVSYQLWFDLDGSAPEFEGRAVIQFELRLPQKGAARGIFLDFEGGRVRSLNFNNSRVVAENEISRERYDGHRIYFDLDELQLGSNRIEVSFVCTLMPRFPLRSAAVRDTGCPGSWIRLIGRFIFFPVSSHSARMTCFPVLTSRT